VDSIALNGRWNGHLAAATTLDGHNWMYLIAFGFMDSESKDNWVWFMTQLRRVIGNMEKVAQQHSASASYNTLCVNNILCEMAVIV
jgi:hypothetical protein